MFAKSVIWLDRWLLRLDIFLLGVAAVSVIIMMLLTSLDVLMRYLLSSPLPWVYDVTTLYMLPAAFVFGFSYTLRSNNHICVDFFARWLPERMRDFWMMAGCAIAGLIFLFIAYISGVAAWDAWVQSEVMFGVLNWPIWPSKAIIPIGTFLLALRCLHTAACSLYRKIELPQVETHPTEEF